MIMTSTLPWLKQKLGDVVEEPDVQAELQSIMRVFKLSEEDVYNKWEAFDISMSSNHKQAPLTIERLKEMRNHIQRNLENEISRAMKSSQTPVRTVKRTSVIGTSSPAGSDL